jgi:hypothetical protein
MTSPDLIPLHSLNHSMAETSRIVNALLAAKRSEICSGEENLFKTLKQQIGSEAEMFKFLA